MKNKSNAPRAPKKGFLRNEDGSIAVWVGMSMTLFVGFSALAIDMGSIYTRQYELQVAADSAALAALTQLANPDDARVLARNYVEQHLPVAEHGTVLQETDIEFGRWNTTTKVFTKDLAPVNALRLNLHKSTANGNAEGMFFSRMFNLQEVDISTSSVAHQRPPASCVLALDPNQPDALKLDSQARITATGCQVTVNSTSSTALSAYSNSNVTAANICVAGQQNTSGGGTFTPPPETNCSPVNDPLANLPEPSSSSCDFPNLVEYDSVTDTAVPGVYCAGMFVKGNADITLDSGVYVMRGGQLIVDGNSRFTGNGVMIFLTEGATMRYDSNTVISLTAPSSGPYAGVVFFQDRDYEATHVFDSNNFSTLEGVVYLPTGIMRSDSNTQIGGSSAFSMYIAKQFDFNSNSGLAINVDYANSPIPLPPGMSGVSRLAM